MIKTHATEAAAAAVSERHPLAGERRLEPAGADAPLPRPSAHDLPERPAPRPVSEPAPHPPEPRAELRPREGNGAAGRHFTAPPENGFPPAAERQPVGNDARRTLHLSLGGGAEPTTAPAAERQPAPPPNRPAQSYATAGHAPPVRMPDTPKNRDGGGIDGALRERVETDIRAFLDAFDAALAGDAPETRAGLREATDRLLRAGARTRIELERLEARVPLPTRDRRDHDQLEWRQR